MLQQIKKTPNFTHFFEQRKLPSMNPFPMNFHLTMSSFVALQTLTARSSMSECFSLITVNATISKPNEIEQTFSGTRTCAQLHTLTSILEFCTLIFWPIYCRQTQLCRPETPRQPQHLRVNSMYTCAIRAITWVLQVFRDQHIAHLRACGNMIPCHLFPNSLLTYQHQMHHVSAAKIAKILFIFKSIEE